MTESLVGERRAPQFRARLSGPAGPLPFGSVWQWCGFR